MNKGRLSYTIIAVVLAVLGMMFILSVLGQVTLSAPAAQEEAVSSPTLASPSGSSDRLERPRLSKPPTQVERGNLVYWSICMACHGDRGQGLTEEWRILAYKEDMDCWTSQCHASDHPTESFEFPRNVPALAGDGRLGRFLSARQLYDFLMTAMPWWNPGSLSSDQGWQVTTYLLKINGALPAGITLDATVASAIPLHRELSLPQNDRPFALALTGVLSILVLSIVLREAAPGKMSHPRAPDLLTHRVRRGLSRPSFISHLHPPAIPAAQARWRYTLGAGGLAVFLCLILALTGLLEMFYYIPTSALAPLTVETIHYFVPLGSLVRNLHYWAGQLLVIVSAIHLLRVVFTGAYSRRRRFNFVLGMALFGLVLMIDFTGYVLRWDEGIRWALATGTNLLRAIPLVGAGFYRLAVGGSQIGPATLVRFYAWHIFVLSAGAAFLLVWHIFRLRRDGGIAAPVVALNPSTNPLVTPSGDSQSSPIIPARIPRSELIRREVLGIIFSSIILVLLAAFSPAPLGAPIQSIPALDAETRAPWFFLWVQQLLKFGDPFLLGVLIPTFILALITMLPWILPRADGDKIGEWFPARGRLAQILLTIIAFVILTLTLLALLPSSNV